MGGFDRRCFLRIAAGATLVARPARAVRRIPRIGLLGPNSPAEGRAALTALRNGLDHLGWSDGHDLVILDRWADGRLAQLPGLAAELVSAGIELVVAAGTPATLAARTASATQPIVMVGVDYPGIRLLSTAMRADGNLTGLSLCSATLTRERLLTLRQLVPGLERIAVMLRDQPDVTGEVEEIRRDARGVGLKVSELVVTSGQTIERAFLWMHANRCPALYFASGPLGPAKQAEVIALAAAARIPAVYPFRVFAAHGGLVSVAADDTALFHRAAGFVDKLLNGTKPSDLPVAEPTAFELVVNLAAARAIGVAIPQALLARADTVIDQPGGA